MNAKIKNYVDVLFTDIPNTRKAAELKEEILSSLNDHFEGHLAEGKSENQAYTEALADLGDVDELLKSIAPENDVKLKLEKYTKFRARMMAISISLYILGAVALIAPAGIAAVFGLGDVEKFGVIGLIALLLLAAIATGLIVYTKKSVPQDVEPFLDRDRPEEKYSVPENSERKGLVAFMKSYWLIVTAFYLLLSFLTRRWDITWLVWLIAVGVRQAILSFAGESKDEKKE